MLDQEVRRRAQRASDSVTIGLDAKGERSPLASKPIVEPPVTTTILARILKKSRNSTYYVPIG
jgi:hypothetical protein